MVSFYLGRTFHRAAPNRTGIPRRVMTIIRMDVDIIAREPENDSQSSDLARWMPGAQVDSVPDALLNPVLYRHGLEVIVGRPRKSPRAPTDSGMTLSRPPMLQTEPWSIHETSCSLQ
jgi:hypothetical protein